MSRQSARIWLFATVVLWAGLCASPALAGSEDESVSRIGPGELRRFMNSFDGEPSIREVQHAALAHAGLERDDETRWAGRARLSNLFPEVDGEIAWLDEEDGEQQYSEEIVPREENGEMYRESVENEVSDASQFRRAYSIEATIDLGGLVFDPDELSASRERRHRETARRKLLAEVTDLYFERRKKQILRVADPPDDWQKRLDLLLAIDRLTARLDGLTGGWFRDQLSDTLEQGDHND